ncbi:VanW family protein [Paenibacillus sp. SC116]|uniref:VanW family protein n=1 Tax=Paenibacillus sp. SC116 TaxID=2968986 RepID=UPI00215AE6E5|nr:VanW family protein [Paenibacillus sp. SC116]MCR8844696.1 VanW family protein [Paenibacillus sp. SC116]
MNEHKEPLDRDSQKQHEPVNSTQPSSSWYSRFFGWVKSHKRKIVAAFGMISILIIGLGTYLAMHLDEAPLPHGYRVMGIDAGGLQPAEVLAKMNEQIAAFEGMTVQFVPDRTDNRLDPLMEQTFTLKELGFTFANEEATKQLQQWEEGNIAHKWKLGRELAEESLDIETSLHVNQMTSAVRKSFGTTIDRKPKNAQAQYITPFKVTYEQEVDGWELDEDKLEQSLIQLVSKLKSHPDVKQPVTVRMPLVTIPADLTVKTLKKRKPNALLGEYTTLIADRGDGHAHNVRASAKALNGVVVSPNQQIRYSDIVKETEEQYGLQIAPVIENGRMVDGIGGGICQTSTTMYNAALFAGMGIVERNSHSLPVPYVPLGRDATYSTGGPDLVLSNETGGDIVWTTQVNGNRLKVQVYGQQLPGITYDVITEQRNSPVLKISNQITEKIAPEKSRIIVDSYRLKKRNGVVVNKERLPQSSYKLHQEEIVEEKERY